MQRILVLSWLVATSAASADLTAITHGGYSGDAAALQAIQADLTADDLYTTAYANYRLAEVLLGDKEKKLADDALEDAVDQLKATVENESDSAEAFALLSLCQGMRIGIKPYKGMFLGPASRRNVDKAMELEPENPRAHFANGVSLLNTPKMFGGGNAKAITEFSTALELYAASEQGGNNWGKVDTYVWRGQAFYRAEEFDRALADWQAALALAPDHRWAKKLIEELEADD